MPAKSLASQSDNADGSPAASVPKMFESQSRFVSPISGGSLPRAAATLSAPAIDRIHETMESTTGVQSLSDKMGLVIQGILRPTGGRGGGGFGPQRYDPRSP